MAAKKMMIMMRRISGAKHMNVQDRGPVEANYYLSELWRKTPVMAAPPAQSLDRCTFTISNAPGSTRSFFTV
jgi:hypothetical protein